jgi:hypothetical protein
VELPGTRPWWIGANDIATEGKYVWAADNATGNINWGTKLGPDSWSPFAPAPRGAYNTTYNPGTLDCVAAGFEDDPIKWGDYACTTQLPFLCAMKGVQQLWPPPPAMCWAACMQLGSCQCQR